MQFDPDNITSVFSGLRISNNFIIDHVSTGAQHHTLGKIIPVFTPFLSPDDITGGLPDLDSARNLIAGSTNILDNLIGGFGKDLILRSAFQPGNGGKVFDIQIEGYENNIFGAARDIESLASRARGLEYNYGSSSFARITFDRNSVNNIGLDTIRTFDSINNIVEQGITSIRGIL